LKKNIVSLLVGGVIVLAVTYMLGGFSGCVNVSEELSSSIPATTVEAVTPVSAVGPTVESGVPAVSDKSVILNVPVENPTSAGTVIPLDNTNVAPIKENAEIKNDVSSINKGSGNSEIVTPKTTVTETPKN